MSWSTNAPAAVARLILTIGLIAMLAAAISAGLHFERAGGRLLTVQTGSMTPLFRPGDAVIVWRVAPAVLKVGDIVSYHSPHDPSVIVSHRIVAISGAQLITRGDALHSNDPPIANSAVIGRASAVAPGLGRLISWLRTPLGLGLAVYLPALLVIADQARRLTGFYRPRSYRLYAR